MARGSFQDSTSTLVSPATFPWDLTGDWFVAHTKPRNEKMLALHLGKLGVYHYLPLTERVTRSPVTRRISRSMIPVFPGYIFFNGTHEDRYKALQTNRIANVLQVTNQQELVAELAQIHALLASQEPFDVANRIKVGDWARITTGPLVGLEGVITRKPGRWRLNMNVTILGQSANVEVDSHSVEPIEPPCHGDGSFRDRSERV